MSFIVILYNLELIQGNETFSTKTQVFKMFKPVSFKMCNEDENDSDMYDSLSLNGKRIFAP